MYIIKPQRCTFLGTFNRATSAHNVKVNVFSFNNVSERTFGCYEMPYFVYTLLAAVYTHSPLSWTAGGQVTFPTVQACGSQND